MLGDIKFALSSPVMSELTMLRVLLVGVLFILGALMMKRENETLNQ
ncbi:hypothetical protein [Helicobacter trogontum]|nr:hypothetical protein [Helicobacter trogontum]